MASSSSSNNNNINNQSSVNNNGNSNSNNNVPAVTSVMAWDLCPANVNNVNILTDEDVVMEDVEEKGAADNNNNRKRHSTSDMVGAAKATKKMTHNDEIVAALEQLGPNENPTVQRAWYYVYMPDGTRALVRLMPHVTTKELTQRLDDKFGNMYCVAARLPGTTEELKLKWSMKTLDMLKVYTVVVMK